MIKEILTFVLNGFNQCINVFKIFVLDNQKGITFFHFLLFIIFIKIVLFIIEFIKHIQTVTNEEKGSWKK